MIISRPCNDRNTIGKNNKNDLSHNVDNIDVLGFDNVNWDSHVLENQVVRHLQKD